MIISKWLTVVGTVFLCGEVLACPACGNASRYGAEVVQDIGNAAKTTVEITQTVTKNYSDTARALYDTGDNIVSAIDAASATVAMEIMRSSEARAGLVEAIKNREEQIAKTEMVAKTNLRAAETHGVPNLHSSLCDSIASADERDKARQTAARLVSEYRKKQIEERKRPFRTGVVDHSIIASTDLSSGGYTELEATLAMEQASLLTGERSFQFSPDQLAAITERGIANGDDDVTNMLSGWLRTSMASSQLGIQIAKRTRPTPVEGDSGSGQSLMGELWRDSVKALSIGGVVEDGAASEIKLLRGIAHRGALNNKILMEKLETTLSLNKIGAAQIGFLAEQSLRQLRGTQLGHDVKTRVRKGDVK